MPVARRLCHSRFSGRWRHAAAAAKKAFDDWEKDYIEHMPLPSAAMNKEVDAQKADGIAKLKELLADLSNDNVSHTTDLLAAHIDKSSSAMALTNEQRIVLKANIAKGFAIKELENEEGKGKGRLEAEEETKLQTDFNEAKSAILARFTVAMKEFDDNAQVMQCCSDMQSKADSVWSIIRSRNQSLVVQARLEREKEDERKKAVAAEEARKKERKKAQQEREDALASAAAASSCSYGGGGCGGGGGGRGDFGSSSGGGGSSKSSHSSSGSSKSTSSGPAIKVSPAGTYHLPNGKFASKAQVEAAGIKFVHFSKKGKKGKD